MLCWGEDELELCDTPRDSLVQAVANAKGNPIVLGAEQIKVIGPVKKGDYLVASPLRNIELTPPGKNWEIT